MIEHPQVDLIHSIASIKWSIASDKLACLHDCQILLNMLQNYRKCCVFCTLRFAQLFSRGAQPLQSNP